MKVARIKEDARLWADSFIGADRKEKEIDCPHGKAFQIDILHKGVAVDNVMACKKCWDAAKWIDKIQ